MSSELSCVQLLYHPLNGNGDGEVRKDGEKPITAKYRESKDKASRGHDHSISSERHRFTVPSSSLAACKSFWAFSHFLRW